MTIDAHVRSPVRSETDDESRSPIFISGISRGGTTWLSRCIDKHPDFAVFGETAFWGRHFEAPRNGKYYNPSQLDRVIRKLKFSCFHGHNTDTDTTLDPRRHELAAALRAFVTSQPDAITPATLFRCAVATIAAIEGKRTAIEKTPHHINHIDRILQHLPNAKFVLILRDPYGFMLSYKHQGDRKEERERRQFERLYHPLLAALVWKRCSNSLRKAVDRYPGRCIELRTEDFADDAGPVLQTVSRFIGQESGDGISQLPVANSSFPGGQRPALTAADVFWMNLISRNHITLAKYALRHHYGGWSDILLSFLKLPLWAFCTAFNIRRRVGGSKFQYVLSYLLNSPSRSRRAAVDGRTTNSQTENESPPTSVFVDQPKSRRRAA